jgi:methylthioribose-1-phosphate isomerase
MPRPSSTVANPRQPNGPPVAVQWTPDRDGVRIIDQRRLPAELVERDLRSVDEMCEAIATLAVRGAPAIGIAGAMGLAAEATRLVSRPPSEFRAAVADAAHRIRRTRPTAVNLGWALDRLLDRLTVGGDNATVAAALRDEADAIAAEDRAMCRRIGEHALDLLPNPARVLTHCNAGALATAGIGTALAPVYLAAAAGRRVEVFVSETRPLLQGARLTAWELSRAGIPVTVLTDGSVASLMRAAAIDCCIVGADRIAANGDVANKIGTYSVAVLAGEHGIPFYVAAPLSTIDLDTPDGSRIPIEERNDREVTHVGSSRLTPEGARIRNPAFDVTPHKYVTAIITERGIARPSFRESLALLVSGQPAAGSGR